jgi:peptidoglycan hydrolase-like protein with peptidoglycan-binding domain
VRAIDVPAVTRKVRVPIVAEAAKVETDAVPAQYGSVTNTVKVSDASVEWRSILCETNATPTKIREIQDALRTAGYNPGESDGIVRQSTMGAFNAYQRAKGLPVDQYFNLATVKSLGVAAK